MLPVACLMFQSKAHLLRLVIVQHFFFCIPIAVLAGSLATMNGTDYLLIARCRSNCTYDKQCNNKCVQNYLENSAYKKYGDCPPKPPSKLDSLCLNTCDGLDYKCPGVERCCEHSCGQSCQTPHGLDKVKGLPPVPFHVLLLEKGRNYRTAQIQWEMKLEEEPSPTYYVVESRFHIGTTYAEHRMENDWQLHMPGSFIQDNLGTLKRYIGELKLKPGRWYQVRVAAVNEMGTRGYSAHSRPFQLSKSKHRAGGKMEKHSLYHGFFHVAGPNPPQPPKSLTVGPLVLNENRTYNCRVSWNLSKSDLPVEKYKLSWSLYLNYTSNRSKTDNSSLFKEMATITAVSLGAGIWPKITFDHRLDCYTLPQQPTRHYDIQGLLPNRYYYLQIQAISVYGKRRLKSAANHLLVNTSTPPGHDGAVNLDNLLMGDAAYRRPKAHPGLKDGSQQLTGTVIGGGRVGTAGIPTGTIRHQFVLRKAGLAVRLSWSEKGFGRYRVHICRGNRDCLMTASRGNGTQYWHDVVLRRNTYEFGKLEFDTRYTVGVRIGGHRRGPGYDIVRTFGTPKCEQIRSEELANVQPANLPPECNV
ncbi:AGAP003441-PA-like protein [Anopheles sinensis]|uniref:AGAP003441-PA-like protein n=1 Tax=Anopheles sinensis TaxID=74873 RepID=A0A084WST1_ANOSI|nr:AGAP003441-PA-like protein [Anopheles sinensis]